MQGWKSTLGWAHAWLVPSLLAGGCLAVDVPENPAPYDDEEVEEVEVDGASQALTFSFVRDICPTHVPGARGAATVAVQLAALFNGFYAASGNGSLMGSSILSSQFYKPGANGGIELVSVNGSEFPEPMRNALEVVQMNQAVRTYLGEGLTRCRNTTNGATMAQVLDFEVVATKLGTSTGDEQVSCVTNPITNCTRRSWASTPWCGARAVALSRYYTNPTSRYDPKSLVIKLYTANMAPAALRPFFPASGVYGGASSSWCSPFDGGGLTQNPYLFIKSNGATFGLSGVTPLTPTQCANDPNCTAAPNVEANTEIDPSTYPLATYEYTNSGARYGDTCALPYTLDPEQPTAHANHQNAWAKRPSDGAVGKFTKRIGTFTITYGWEPLMTTGRPPVPRTTCP